ncbi:MAG TPA: DMT family transporter, partial [Steroidobacter sp.]|nr:DMT family transporter [Steroidobacter sp.]
MSSHTRAWLQIHFCVILWGFTAILGKLISLSALALVWWRMALVSAALLLVKRFWVGLARLPPALIAIYAGIGVVVALHWFTFYASIKLSNASVAATCMALTPVFIAFVEPLLAQRSFDPRELIFGLMVIPGVMLVVGGTPDGMRMGVGVGAASAFLVAIFASLNKRFIANSDVLAVTGIEMGAGVVMLTLATLADSALLAGDRLFSLPSPRDALLLIALALGCTLAPFALSLVALRQLSAFSTALAVNMEPIYAIILAVLLLGEQRELSIGFYVGVAIILGVVFAHPWISDGRSHTRSPLTGAAAAARRGRG